MKAFLDYLEEIKISPDFKPSFEFQNRVLVIRFCRDTSTNRFIKLYPETSYNLEIFTNTFMKYKCKSHRIFYLSRVFTKHTYLHIPINLTSMRFL